MEKLFYRTKDVDLSVWSGILKGMENWLGILRNGEVGEDEAAARLNELFSQARPWKSDPGRCYLDFADPEGMPGDARFDFIFRPTFLAVAIAMRTLLRFPRLAEREALSGDGSLSGSELLRILSACMQGSCANGFRGHGYDALSGVIDTMSLFRQAGADAFLAEYPALCPAFSECYDGTLKEFEKASAQGTAPDLWGEEHVGEIRALLEA